jgi:hypothetical protein
MSQLAQQPLGKVLLWVMAIGLLSLVLWQGLEAVIGRGDRKEALKHRARSIGRAIVYLALGVLSARTALGAGSHSGKGEQTLSAQLLKLPAGVVLVIAVGVGVLAVGISQIVKGAKKKFRNDLDQSVNKPIETFGIVGYVAKGVSLGIIGALFGLAAITYDPKKAGGMDAALLAIRDQPFGAILLIVMAAGIACFGLFCFAWARYARY